MVEHFFDIITQKTIRRGVFRSVKELERAIKDFLRYIMKILKYLKGLKMQKL